MNILDIAKKINAEFVGNKKIKIDGVASHINPSSGKIIFIGSINLAKKMKYPSSTVVLTSEEISPIFHYCNVLISKKPKLSFIKLLDIFNHNQCIYESLSDINSPYVLGKNVSIGKNIKIGKNVVIEDSVQIGDNVCIGHNVVIHSNVKIDHCVIIGSSTVIGSEGFGNFYDNDLNWQHIPHIGGVSIGKKVRIGSGCSIDRGTIDNTIIEDGVFIDNQVHIAHNVLIGENTAIAANVGIAGSCKIGKRNMIGGMVGITDHIITADDVIISATSTVSKDLKQPGTYTGIMPIAEHLRWKRIAFWITKLDKILKKLNI